MLSTSIHAMRANEPVAFFRNVVQIDSGAMRALLEGRIAFVMLPLLDEIKKLEAPFETNASPWRGRARRVQQQDQVTVLVADQPWPSRRSPPSGTPRSAHGLDPKAYQMATTPLAWTGFWKQTGGIKLYVLEKQIREIGRRNPGRMLETRRDATVRKRCVYICERYRARGRPRRRLAAARGRKAGRADVCAAGIGGGATA